MGVIDKVSDTVSSLLPARRHRREEHSDRSDMPPVGAEVLALRDNLDRWLQRFFDEPWGFPAAGDLRLKPSVNVRETDTEVVVTAEMPGLDTSDVDLTIRGHALVIRGVKREEREDARGSVHVAERRYGSFLRTVALPDDVDAERAEARVDRGVLTVRLPKAESGKERRRIPIRT